MFFLSLPRLFICFFFFFFNDTATTEIYTLSLHDALPIHRVHPPWGPCSRNTRTPSRSEEHTSELQSRSDLVCRLLLEKKKKTDTKHSNNLNNSLIKKEQHNIPHK